MCQELAIPMTACRKWELQTVAGGHSKYWYVVDSGGVRSYAPLRDDVPVARSASPSWAGFQPTGYATIRRLAFGPIVRPLTIGVELFRLCRPSCVVWRAIKTVPLHGTGAAKRRPLGSPRSSLRSLCPTLVNTRGISGSPEGLGTPWSEIRLGVPSPEG